MCGLIAVIRPFKSSKIEMKNLVKSGLNRIRHRGPDGDGIWISHDEKIGLGHVRLAILDIDSGAQPMSLDDGTTIVFNGEIYNYIELRQELGISLFHTTSDTEVILHAYKRWGADCVNHLRGMFAFVIWDEKKQDIFFARDRFGIKPLYWYRDEDGIYFSSEVKGLLPYIKHKKIDENVLSEYFSFQFSLTDGVLLKGVKQVQPAHFGWVLNNHEVKLTKYWEVHYDVTVDDNDKYYIEQLQYLLNESVKLHLRADVEVGAYVSGGLDSSLLALLGSNYSSNDNSDFKIFNGRFCEGSDFDESSYAKVLADENAMDFHLASITESDFVDSISDVIYHLDTPVAGPGAFPQYMVSQLASQHLKVVFGGQGGDEIFGGYARYLIAYFEQCIVGGIDGTLNNGNFVVSYESIIPNLKTLKAYKPLIKEFWSDGLFSPRDQRYFRLINRSNTIEPILKPGVINREKAFDEFKRIFWGKNVGKESYFDQMTHFDFKTLLPALLQVEDRMSMAHGLESRVPFLDHPLVEAIAKVPANIKFLNGELKRLLRKAFIKKMPAVIRDRKDKMGFPVPLNIWLKQGGKARDFIGDVFSSKDARSRFYLAEQFDLDGLLDSQNIYGRNLWALLSLELWQQQFID